ncbi:hypothetical protein Adt_27005 [Abeliophyllum distichum]|uniref:Uncharacterized protein n=1 Tax=Abeliophyllum distichum TaxID=126358 RepID=A0ABD1RUH4_9LAMI
MGNNFGHRLMFKLRPRHGVSQKKDWFDAHLDPVGNDMESLLVSRKKGKLVPNRGNSVTSSQSQETNAVYHFMPTPGVNLQGQREGPAPSSLHVVGGKSVVDEIRMKEVDITPMVEDLERLNAEEAAIARARARSQINTRSSHFVPPRSR